MLQPRIARQQEEEKEPARKLKRFWEERRD
jgi:hypothetical protein